MTGEENLCMAGGVAFNSVMNGRIFHETPFKTFFVQPAAGDAGCQLGCRHNMSGIRSWVIRANS